MPLSRDELLEVYRIKCEENKREANRPFLRYLEDINEEDDAIDIIIRGNDRLNFNYRIEDLDLIVICGTLESYSECLLFLDFSYNHIGDTGAMALARLIGGCPNLEGLNLQGNSIEHTGSQHLIDGLKQCPNLEYLNLSWNSIQTDGAMAVIELLNESTRLVELNLANNEIGHDAIIAISTVLNTTNNSLRILNLDNPRIVSIDQELAIHFAKMLYVNTGIERLSLRKHKLRDPGLFTITEHILDNTTLRVLDLNSNEISVQGSESIAKYLKGKKCQLESLFLANNQVATFGARAISQALSVNRTLLHLDLCYNNIEDQGLTWLAESLFQNPTLISFKVFGNHFEQRCLRLFHEFANQEHQRDWNPDFVTYIVDDEVQMAKVDETLENFQFGVSS